MARRRRPDLKFEDPVAFVARRLEGRRPPGPFAEGAFSSPLHDERVAARVGLALGVAFLACFATGLLSHFAQHPLHVGALSMPASPAWLYRVSQGVHVASGIASIPLLAVKLWTVYPLLFTWPPARNVPHATERAFIAPLVAVAIFQLFSGLANTTRWYPWEFNFTVTHFWTGWILIGALVVHIGAKFHQTRRVLRTPLQQPDEPAPAPGTMSRRGLLWTAGAAAGAVTLTTVGQTFRPLKELAALAPRKPDIGPQGFPVNRTARGANVLMTARAPEYRLKVSGDVPKPFELTLDELRALPQHVVSIPITCVEGWSAGATWTGIRVADLLERAEATDHAEVVVKSLQTRGSYRSSELNAIHARHPHTLLALRVGGEELHIDHGFPCRLIAPDRPGVQQTKWVSELEVRT